MWFADVLLVVVLVLVLVVVVRRARGDVVDLEIVLAFVSPVLVVFVQAADRALLDGTFWTAIVLSGLFPFVLGRRIRAEITIAIRRRPPTAAAVRPRRPSAWTWSKAASTPAAWSAAGSGGVTARTRSSDRPLFAWSSLAYRERTSLERLLIESTDRSLRDCAIRIVNECESARTPGFTIDRKNNLSGFTDAGEVLS